MQPVCAPLLPAECRGLGCGPHWRLRAQPCLFGECQVALFIHCLTAAGDACLASSMQSSPDAPSNSCCRAASGRALRCRLRNVPWPARAPRAARPSPTTLCSRAASSRPASARCATTARSGWVAAQQWHPQLRLPRPACLPCPACLFHLPTYLSAVLDHVTPGRLPPGPPCSPLT